MPVRVTGLKPFLRATQYAEKGTKKVIRDRFRKAGEIVQHEATSLFSRYDAKSAAGYRTVVRIRGVAVEQRYRKTTGLRPDFGRLQMRVALLPALEAKETQVVLELERGLNELATVVERL